MQQKQFPKFLGSAPFAVTKTAECLYGVTTPSTTHSERIYIYIQILHIVPYQLENWSPSIHPMLQQDFPEKTHTQDSPNITWGFYHDLMIIKYGPYYYSGCFMLDMCIHIPWLLSQLGRIQKVNVVPWYAWVDIGYPKTWRVCAQQTNICYNKNRYLRAIPVNPITGGF